MTVALSLFIIFCLMTEGTELKISVVVIISAALIAIGENNEERDVSAATDTSRSRRS